MSKLSKKMEVVRWISSAWLLHTSVEFDLIRFCFFKELLGLGATLCSRVAPNDKRCQKTWANNSCIVFSEVENNKLRQFCSEPRAMKGDGLLFYDQVRRRNLSLEPCIGNVF